MSRKDIVSLFLLFITSAFVHPLSSFSQKTIFTDVLIVGGGTGGTAAGITAARSGVRTIIAEPTRMLGGMLTAAGVSCTDGNDSLPGGIWQAFRSALHEHYHRSHLASGWVSETCFEPHVGDSVFKAWAGREKDLTVMYSCHFLHALRSGNTVTGALFRINKDTIRIMAAITIDGTELGDVLAGAGAAYDTGTEDSTYSGEKMAPGKTGIIQDITWVATLKDYGIDKTIARPPGYDASQYYCCCTSAPCTGKAYPVDAAGMLNYGKLPNDKYMINWPAHGNDDYLNVIEDDDSTRSKKYASAKLHTLGFIYFIQTTLGFRHLAPADDELDSGLAWIPYNREGRRVKGMVRLNVNALIDPYGQAYPLYRTGIAVGDYPVDHHHGQNPNTPDIRFPKIPSFNIPLGALIPQSTGGLIVCEKGISVSNIVNGATRLQPVVLLTGESAGTLAAWCIQHHRRPREADIRAIQQQLLEQQCYLVPYIDVAADDPAWQAVQRIGLTGILRGRGKPEGWANRTFFDPDSTISFRNFISLLESFEPYREDLKQNKSLLPAKEGRVDLRKIAAVFEILHTRISPAVYPGKAGWMRALQAFLSLHVSTKIDPGQALTKKEIAVLVDHFLDPFSFFPIDLHGNIAHRREN